MGIEEWQHLILSSLWPHHLTGSLSTSGGLSLNCPAAHLSKLEPHDPVAMGWFWTCWNASPQPRWLARALWAAEPRGHLVPALSSLTSIFLGRAKIQKRLGSRDLRLHFLICKMKVIEDSSHTGNASLRDPVTPELTGDWGWLLSWVGRDHCQWGWGAPLLPRVCHISSSFTPTKPRP